MVSNVPLVAALYHCIVVPAAALAVKLADVPGQIVAPLAVGAEGTEFTVTVTAVRGLMQPFCDVVST